MSLAFGVAIYFVIWWVALCGLNAYSDLSSQPVAYPCSTPSSSTSVQQTGNARQPEGGRSGDRCNETGRERRGVAGGQGEFQPDAHVCIDGRPRIAGQGRKISKRLTVEGAGEE